MAIWFNPSLSVDDLNQRGAGTMSDFLGIRFTEIGEDRIIATMPASEKTRQPVGIIHGGANVVLAETLASSAANAVVNLKTHYCVGLEINANHIRSVKEGLVSATTYPLHLGRTTQIWHIDIHNEEGKLTCVSRMTAAVLSR